MKHWIGFDLGGTKMLAALLNDDLKVIDSVKVATKGHDGALKGMVRITEAIDEVLENNKLSRKDLSGIGMACPGVVDMKAGLLRLAPNLGWKEVPIGADLEDRYKVPVQLLNDVDAGAYGEYAHGAGQDAETLLAVFPGTGVGGGCVINGQLLRGKQASCMEIGNMRMPTTSLLGEVGAPPRLETLCSRLAIACAAVGEAYKGNAPYLLDEGGTDITEIKSGVIAKSIKNGDKAIQEIVDNAAWHLGVGISGAVDLLGPDVLVLGGGLVEKMPDLFLKKVRKAIDAYASPALAEQVEVREASLGDDAVVVGAAAWTRSQSKE